LYLTNIKNRHSKLGLMKEKPLSGIAKKVFDDLSEIYKLDDSALYLARIVAVAWGHMLKAEEMLEKEGLTVTGRYSQLRSHPANDIVKSNRNQIMRALRQLNLATPANDELDMLLADFK